MNFEEFKKRPKGELHVHLEGALQPERLLEFAAGTNHPWNGLSVTEFKEQLDTKTFMEFIDVFMKGYALLREARHYQAITEDLCQTFEEQGVVYAEVLYSPGVGIQKLGRSLKQIHDGIAAGLAHFPHIKVRFILDTVLNMGFNFMQTTLNEVLKDRRPFIEGFSVGGGVPTLNMGEFVPLFHQAHREGLFCVAHAGEVDGPENIRILAEETDIKRIAHGCNASKEPEVCDLMREKGIAVDVNLTSNLFTGVVARLEEHPIKLFMEKGLKITLNTDDPLYFHTNLFQEYQLAHEQLGIPMEKLLEFMDNALDGSGQNR